MLCLESQVMHLEGVSTGSGSDRVAEQHAIFLLIWIWRADPPATAGGTDHFQVRINTFEARLRGHARHVRRFIT